MRAVEEKLMINELEPNLQQLNLRPNKVSGQSSYGCTTFWAANNARSYRSLLILVALKLEFFIKSYRL